MWHQKSGKASMNSRKSSTIIQQLKAKINMEQEHGVRDWALGRPQKTRTQKAPEQSLQKIRDEIGDCRRCKLCTGRTHIVFGVGNPHARLMFVGEGPGRDEDIQGEPFVGRAGQLLTKM